MNSKTKIILSAVLILFIVSVILSVLVLKPSEKHNVEIVQDGKIITARGAGVATQFGFKLVEVLKGIETSEAVKAAILW